MITHATFRTVCNPLSLIDVFKLTKHTRDHTPRPGLAVTGVLFVEANAQQGQTIQNAMVFGSSEHAVNVEEEKQHDGKRENKKCPKAAMYQHCLCHQGSVI